MNIVLLWPTQHGQGFDDPLPCDAGSEPPLSIRLIASARRPGEFYQGQTG
jgi:hypothetical protein